MITTRFKHAATLLMLLTLTMAYGTSVQAAMETLEDAYELNTKQILRWPLRTGDSLVVKPCDSCNVTTLQVTEETRYSTGFDAPFISLHDLLNEKTRLNLTANMTSSLFFSNRIIIESHELSCNWNLNEHAQDLTDERQTSYNTAWLILTIGLQLSLAANPGSGR